MAATQTDARAQAVRRRQGLAMTIGITAATVGVIYGYDTGSIAGALLFIPAQFKLSTSATEWITTFTGIGLIPGALAANRLADRIGRRVTLLIGVGVMVASNALLVILYASGSHFSGVRSALGFVGFLFFTAGFNFGFGAMVWVYASESFPARLRTAGASAMLTADLLANLLISRFFLTVLKSLGGTGTFALFLGLAGVSFGFILTLVPETRGRPLEAIRVSWENGGHWPPEPALEAALEDQDPAELARS